MEDSSRNPSLICSPASSLSPERLEAALKRATSQLLAARTPDGHWAGELSSSALSTATAVIALAIVEGNPARNAREGAKSRPAEALRTPHRALHTGLAWLAAHANSDGGWGDTTQSLSNISTTALCWAAFGAVPGADEAYRATVAAAEKHLAAQTISDTARTTHHAPRFTPPALAAAILRRYGKDRTFSAPILTACALAGRLGSGPSAWRQVLALPFELAACPHRWFAALRLPVVSYALPALIAIGQARHFHLPSRNPLVRLVRKLARRRTLEVLGQIQPSNGGFLEATPLTSFVVMSLAGSGQAHHPVTEKGVEFLLKSQRPDGSWPIDTNLATWLTTLAADAFSDGPLPPGDWPGVIHDWLLRQQYRSEHPYTHAAPGGWAWTDLPGGVPDADDTAGALLALRQCAEAERSDRILSAADAGITWLLDVQNRDGGIPTFCRGWGALPFDRSSADLTAHALRAWLAWLDELPPELQQRITGAIPRALQFLAKAQRPDGAWVPLWFGNQFAPGDENPTYGTARVARALCTARRRFPGAQEMLAGGARWLLAAQNTDGGWGGAAGDCAGLGVASSSILGLFSKTRTRTRTNEDNKTVEVPSSVEETALAVEALAVLLADGDLPCGIAASALKTALVSGANWLLARIESGDWTHPSPIGFYFAKLWYFEKLYPQIFTVAALKRVARVAHNLS